MNKAGGGNLRERLGIETVVRFVGEGHPPEGAIFFTFSISNKAFLLTTAFMSSLGRSGSVEILILSDLS